MNKPPTHSPEIARSLMHGLPFNGQPLLPALVSEKLNGLRCVYVPGKGFYSKTGKRWNDAVLAHITINSDIPVDGELYCRDMSLQDIVDNVGVNNLAPGARAGEIKLWAFDVINKEPALARDERVRHITSVSSNVVAHSQMIVERESIYRIVHDSYARTNCEGLMVKRVDSLYQRGRKGQLLKIKFFQHIELPLVSIVEGEGKATGAVGSFVFEFKGKRFEVGTAQISYDKRREIFLAMQQPYSFVLYTARIRYLNLSDDGIPLNASVEAIWEDVL